MIDVVLKSQGIDGDVGGTVHGGTEDSAFQTLAGAYVGGQPVGLGASGFVFGTAVTDANYIGMFFNNSLIDSNVGANLVGTSVSLATTLPTIVWKGPCKVRLFLGTKHNIADVRAPFSSGVTWVLGDHMYIDTTHGGQWTNASGANTKVSHGRALDVPASATDTLEAQMFDILNIQGQTG